MNRKIPFHELASLLAGNCNISPAEAEDFIKSFFELITQSLSSGETVKIKGIGTFAPSDDAANPVSFIPDTEISDTINAPFAMFEPEEVSDTLTDDAFDALDNSDSDAAEAIDNEPTQTQSEDTPVQIKTDETALEVNEEVALPTEVISKVNTAEITEITLDAESKTDVSEESQIETMPEVTETPADDNRAQTVQPEEEPIPVSASIQTSIAEQAPAPATATPTPVTPVVSVPAVAPTINPQPAATFVQKPVSKPTIVTPTPLPEEEPEEYYEEPRHKSGAGFDWGFIIGMLVGLALGACGVYFAIDYLYPTAALPVEETASEEEVNALLASAEDLLQQTQAADSIMAAANIADSAKSTNIEVEQSKEAPQAQSTPATATPVKDTIRTGYLLNDMAKKHYGNKCFWVYIYEENKAKISNPNRVGPGLELVIPPASKYGIDASSQASVKAANAKAGKILAKFPR